MPNESVSHTITKTYDILFCKPNTGNHSPLVRMCLEYNTLRGCSDDFYIFHDSFKSQIKLSKR